MPENLKELLDHRKELVNKQRQLFLETVQRINIGNQELLKSDFGGTLVKNIGRDLAGEVIRRYFDTSDYYVTADQLIDRFINFSYEDEKDFLMSDEETRKSIYNRVDSINSASMKQVQANAKGFQKQLFEGNRNRDRLDAKAKKDYRNSKVESRYEKDGKIYGKIRDELTGKEKETNSKPNNKNDFYSEGMDVDHRQPRESSTYNERYIKFDEYVLNKRREFVNSEDNLTMMSSSANRSKGDVRVCMVDGKIKYMNPKEKDYDPKTDITTHATPEQLTEAFVHQLEKANPKTMEKLKEEGYLDENGKVREEVKEEYRKKMAEMQQARQDKIGDLEDLNYKNIAVDAGKETLKAMNKIIAGQLIYYVMPPVIFETRLILSKEKMTLERFFKEFQKSEKRIVAYVKSKMGEILKNVGGHGLNKFIKTFFSIIIEMVKTTLKKMMRVIKDVLLSLINCIKTLMNPNMNAAEKGDAITKILFTTINAIVLEIFFEYLEKQFALPNIIMEPLQVIVTVLSTNLIMLVLEKADLFNVRYGFIIANMEALFQEENNRFLAETEKMLREGFETSERELEVMKFRMEEIVHSFEFLDLRKEDVSEDLEQINQMFSIGINFQEEWDYFRGKHKEVAI